MANNPNAKANLTNQGKGRQKGSKNKFTSLKDSFLQAFEKMGGTEALMEWGEKEKNKKDFYGMIAKMLPNKVEGDLSGKMTVIFQSNVPEPEKPPDK